MEEEEVVDSRVDRGMDRTDRVDRSKTAGRWTEVKMGLTADRRTPRYGQR